MMLLPIYLRLICPPPLTPKPYSLLIPPAHGRQGSCPPILRHRKVEYWPFGNLLCHTGVTAGDIFFNQLQTCIF